MITKRIIPCLDVKDGRVVKGVNFQGLRDLSSPVELGKYYSDSGADELVFYDITASAEGRRLFTDVLTEGQEVDVKLLEIDEKTGKMRLSMRALTEKPEGWVEPKPRGPRGGGERGPRREGGDRGPRREGGDRGPRREGGDRGPRREGGERAPRRPFGQKSRPQNDEPQNNEPEIF